MSEPRVGRGERPPLRTLAIVALAFVSTVMLFSPTQLYYDNSREFSHELSRGWAPQCGRALATLVIAILVLRWLTPARFAKGVAALTVSLTSLLWAQGAFLSADIGRLDGAPKRWNLLLAAASTLLWVGALIVAYRNRRQFAPYLSFTAAALILAQVVGLATAVLVSPPGARRPYRLADKDAFTYSREQNVVILVIDSAQSTVFRDLLLERGNREAFAGFTLYADTLGGFPTTVASVPLILTGRYYDNSVSLDDFWAEVAPGVISTRLRAIGYQAYIQPIELLPARPIMADNVVPNFFDAQDWRRLTLLAAFRMLPSVARIAVYDRTMIVKTPEIVATTSPDILFLNSMKGLWRVVDGPRQFKYYHLFGMHLPYSLDEQLRTRVVREATWLAARRQARAEIEIVHRWLKRLQDDGIYDDTFVVVLGDHGAPPLADEPAQPSEGEASAAVDSLPISIATPLLLVKPFGARGSLDVSEAAATLADVSATVLAALNLPTGGGSGRDLAKLNTGTPRVRSYYHYSWDGDWDRAYMPTMLEFKVRGPAHDPRSWERTGRILMSGKSSMTPEYAYGTTLEPNADSALPQYCVSGFGGPESGIMWTTAPAAHCVLHVARPPAGSALRVSLSLTPHLGPGLTHQDLQLTANDAEIAAWRLDGSREVRGLLPPGLVNRQLHLQLSLPNARSPFDLGISSDPRRLGAALRSLRIDLVMPAPTGALLTAGQGGTAAPYLGEGWSAPELGFTWSDGPDATLEIPVTRPSGSALRLSMALSPYTGPGVDRQVVEVTANGSSVGSWALSQPDQISVHLAPELVGRYLRLVLHLPNARSPRQLGRSSDPRRLGVALSSLRLDLAGSVRSSVRASSNRRAPAIP
jgi:sulfatase-like protein